jgi:hypothetical protein
MEKNVEKTTEDNLPTFEELLEKWRKEPNWDNIRTCLGEFLDIAHWVCWIAKPKINEKREIEISKPPISPKTGKLVDVASTAPEKLEKARKLWGTFEEVKEFWKTHTYVVVKEKNGKNWEDKKYPLCGIGIVLTSDLGVVGIDLDHVIDSEGNLLPSAQEIIQKLDNYAEKSPSEKGVRSFPKGKKPGEECKQIQPGGWAVESYEKQRFVTVTGNHIPGTPTTSKQNQEAIDWLYETYLANTPNQESIPLLEIKTEAESREEEAKPIQTAKTSPSSSPVFIALDDDPLIKKAMHAKDGEKFRLLWSGNWKAASYHSQSEADLALCTQLAFWYQGDKAKIDAMFRRSGLYRQKWDEHHGNKTYGEMTMEKAISSVSTIYSPQKNITTGEKRREKIEVLEPEPLEPLIKEKDIELDLDQIHPVFSRYWANWEGKTEAPKEYVLPSFLVAGGATMGNKVVLKIGTGIRPNMYLLLLGSSTFMKKTTSMDIGIEALSILSEEKKRHYLSEMEHYKEDLEAYENLNKKDRKNVDKPQPPIDNSIIYANELSPEQLLRKMEHKPDGLFAYSEFGGFLANLNHSYMAGFKEKLTEFYDGRPKPYRRETVSGGCITIENPAPSLIACSTPEWLQIHMADTELKTGWLGRFLIVFKKTYPKIDIAIPPYFQLAPSWVELFRKLDKLQLSLTISEEASKLYTDWYGKYKKWAIEQDTLLHPFLGRLLTACPKIAIINHGFEYILSGSSRPEVVQAKAYEQAFPWIKFFTLNIVSSYSQLTQKTNIKEERVREIIRKKGKQEGELIIIPQWKLCAYANLTKKDLLEVLEMLEMKRLVRKLEKGKYVFWAIRKIV